MQQEQEVVVSSDVGWGSEKLPIDVVALIMHQVWLDESHRCVQCKLPYVHELRTKGAVNMQLTCRRWHLGFYRFILFLTNKRNAFCMQPQTCIHNYVRASPALPFLHIPGFVHRKASERAWLKSGTSLRMH